MPKIVSYSSSKNGRVCCCCCCFCSDWICVTFWSENMCMCYYCELLCWLYKKKWSEVGIWFYDLRCRESINNTSCFAISNYTCRSSYIHMPTLCIEMETVFFHANRGISLQCFWIFELMRPFTHKCCSEYCNSSFCSQWFSPQVVALFFLLVLISWWGYAFCTYRECNSQYLISPST